MNHSNSKSNKSNPLSARLGRLGKVGRNTLLAAIAPSTGGQAPQPKALELTGQDLAAHHIDEAFRALQKAGLSTTESFRKIRFLTGKLEQREHGRIPAIVPVISAKPELSRRARLLGALENAYAVTGWRPGARSRDTHQQTHS